MTSPTPPKPPGVPDEAAVQQQEQLAQQAEVAQSDELRAFIAELVRQTQLGFDPSEVRKGTVTAISAATTPPTLTLNVSGDTTVPVAGVRYIDSYSPTVNDTVLILKQASQVFALGKIAEDGTTGQGGGSGGWTQLTLSSGFTQNGNGEGNVEARKVWDNGSWKMQWRGAANRSANSTIIAAADMPADFRPTLPRTIVTGGSSPVLLSFNTDGSVVLTGSITSNLQNIGATGASGNSHTHSHNNAANTVASFVETHTHSLDHTHQVQFTNASVTGVSFNGVEYFL